MKQEPGKGNYGSKAFELLVTGYQEVYGVSRAKAIKAVAKEHPRAHELWLETLKEEQGVRS